MSMYNKHVLRKWSMKTKAKEVVQEYIVLLSFSTSALGLISSISERTNSKELNT